MSIRDLRGFICYSLKSYPYRRANENTSDGVSYHLFLTVLSKAVAAEPSLSFTTFMIIGPAATTRELNNAIHAAVENLPHFQGSRALIFTMDLKDQARTSGVSITSSIRTFSHQ